MSIDDLIARLKVCVAEMENAFEDDDEERQSAALTEINDIIAALDALTARNLFAERKRGAAD